MRDVLLISAGAVAGALARHYLNILITGILKPAGMPAGIIAVNLTGCFVIGILYGLDMTGSGISRHMKLLAVTGFLGSFTTFSTFGIDTLDLMQKGFPWKALLNILISVGGGILACWLGMRAAVRMF